MGSLRAPYSAHILQVVFSNWIVDVGVLDRVLLFSAAAEIIMTLDM